MGLEFLGGGSSSGTDATAIHKADYTAKGVILSATATGTPVAATVGADGLVPVASAADAKGWVWGSPNDPNALHKADFTTKGDLLAATGSGAYTRVGVGADGQRLEADSSQTSGVKWAAKDAVWTPADNGLLGWTYDPVMMSNAGAPTAAVAHYHKIKMPAGGTIANVLLWLSAGGSGATPLANCFVAVYNSAGTRLGASADQAANWTSGSSKVIPVTVDGGQSLTVAPAAGAYVWVSILVGTQATTQVTFMRTISGPGASGLTDVNLTAANFRAGTAGAALTSPPTTFTPSAMATINPYWVGLS